WRPPEVGIIKINFDASFIKEKGLATTAVLARNYKGDVLWAETYLFENITDSFVVEARACERALIFARNMRCQRLVVEGDALTVIKTPTSWRWKVGEEVVAGVGLPTYQSWFVWWCGRTG
ncbi:hypothetical protein Goari_027046, partial [Gossypium aridum]|nr:hypothetical protein [Gossypium aridum]